MMKFTTKIAGLANMLNGMRRLPAMVAEENARSLYTAANEVITESKANYVPVDTGALRSSGYVELPKSDGKTATVELGFGGPAGRGNVGGESNREEVGYAFYVHENLGASHTVGSAKFLSQPLNQGSGNIQRRLDEGVNRARNRAGLS